MQDPEVIVISDSSDDDFQIVYNKGSKGTEVQISVPIPPAVSAPVVESRITEVFEDLVNGLPEKYRSCSAGYRVERNNGATRLGLCNFRRKTIYVNEKLEPEKWKGTLLHELAHAIAWGLYKDRGHTKLWSSICVEIGGDGHRCGNSSALKDIRQTSWKFKWMCPKDGCGKEYKYMKRPPLKVIKKGNKLCGVCKTRLKPVVRLKK